MEEGFDIWLKRELEQAKRDEKSTDMWPRKKAQDRSDKLKVALQMLAEFKPIYKDQKLD